MVCYLVNRHNCIHEHVIYSYIQWIPLCSFWRARYRRQNLRKIHWKHVLSLQSLSLPSFPVVKSPFLCVASLFFLLMSLLCCFRTQTKMNEMLGNVNTSNALSAFEKMEEKGKMSRMNICISHISKVCFVHFINPFLISKHVLWNYLKHSTHGPSVYYIHIDTNETMICTLLLNICNIAKGLTYPFFVC